MSKLNKHILKTQKMDRHMPSHLKKCSKLENGEHEIIYPRLEPSIDKDRKYPEPYCKYCFKTIGQINAEWKKYLETYYPGRIGGSGSGR